MNSTKKSYKTKQQYENATNDFGHIRTISWRSYSYPNVVVNMFTVPTFPVITTVVQLKVHTFKIVYLSFLSHQRPTVITRAEVIKIRTHTSKIKKR